MKTFIFYMFFLLVFSIQSFAKEDKVLKIAITKNFIPYTFINNKGEADGIFVDYWKLWAEKNNKEIKFIPFTWKEGLKAISEKKVDIHSGLFKSASREKTIDFSLRLYPSIGNAYINTNNEKNKIEDISDSRIGAVRGSYYEEYVKENFPYAKIYSYIKQNDMVDAHNKNKVDIIFDDSVTSYFRMVRSLTLGLVKKVDGIEIKRWFHIGIQKDNELLRKIVEEGAKKISLNEFADIEQKWIKVKELQSLNKNRINFNKAELEYLQNNPSVRIAIGNWKPIYFMEDGKVGGVIGGYIEEFNKLSGLRFEIVEDSWQNNLNDFKDGKIDLLPSVFYTKKREELGKFSKQYLIINTKIYTKANNDTIKDFKSLENKRLGVVEGDERFDFIQENFPQIQLVKTIDIKDGIYKLLEDKVDAIIGTDIIVNTLLRELFILNIKSINQDVINSRSVHMLTQNSNPLLNSIINKMFTAINKNNIQEKFMDSWLGLINNNHLKITMGKIGEPYSIEKGYEKGIEYDLINSLLNTKVTKIENINKVTMEKLYKGFEANDNSDILVGVKAQEDDEFYYSDGFIEFENIIVSRIEDNIQLKSLIDLKSYKVIAFKGASKFLGAEFKSLFDTKEQNKDYVELESQKAQVQNFLDKKADIIILDRHIFKWFLKQVSNKGLKSFKVHNILKHKNKMEVAFKNKSLRDFFNKKLKELKLTGKYKEILEKYTGGYVKEKTELISLVSSLYAPYINQDNKKLLSELSIILFKLPFFEGIEVYNIHGAMILSKGKKTKHYILEDSYLIDELKPRKVGGIKFYYSLDKFENAVKKTQFLPALDSFLLFEEYFQIKSIYEHFDMIKEDDLLSIDEKEYIRKNPIVRFSEVNYAPLSIIKNGEVTGLFKDYLDLISHKTGLEFKFVPYGSWPGAIKAFDDRKIDLLPTTYNKLYTNKNPEAAKGLVSSNFEVFPYIIIGAEDANYAERISDLDGKTLALPKYSAYRYIKRNYPKINIIEVENVEEALKTVDRGDAYAFVGHYAVAITHLQKSFPRLKVLGTTDDKYYHFFMTPSDNTILHSIIKKAIDSIDDSTRLSIRNKWIQADIETEVSYALIYRMLGGFLFLVAIFLFWNYELKSMVRKKTNELRLLLKSFDKSVIASRVDEHGTIIYVTKAFCKKFGYKESELLGATHSKLRHPDLDNNILSSLLSSYEDKTKWKGELRYLTKNNEDFWAYVRRIPEYDDKGEFLDFITIFTDITNHKKVENLNYELNNLLSSFDENVIASKTDAEGNVIYVSNAFCEISKYTRAEIFQSNHSLIRYKAATNEFYEELWDTISKGQIWRGEIDDVNKEGNRYWLYTIITPEYDVKGNFLCYTAISQDITPQKYIAQANREIEILNTEIEDTQKEVVFRMGAIAEARSKETGAHVKRVAEYSKLLALYSGLSDEEAETLKLASPMHDIGKVAIPDQILNKPGKFTNEEFEVMKSHTTIGYEMLKTSDKAILKVAAIVAYEHQEKYDGSGYPRGLKGNDIHIYGRITAIADVFDALGSDRCYKKAWDDERIFKMFKEERGKHFDPLLIDAFFEHLDEFLAIRDKIKDDED